MKRSRKSAAIGAVIGAALVVASLQAASIAAPVHDGHQPKVDLGALVYGPSKPLPAVATGAVTHSSAPVASNTTLPKPGAFTISLTGKANPAAPAVSAPAGVQVSGAWHPVGTTVLSVAQASRPPATTTSKIRVEILDAAVTGKLHLTGVALRLTRVDGVASPAPVAMNIPASLTNGLFGADYSARIRWVQLPASATAAQLTAGTVRPVAVGMARQPSGSTVVTPTVSPTATMLVATASPVSSTGTGTWAATSLKTSSSWQVSTQSGDFEWSYPFQIPPAAAGPSPDLSLSYSSGSVDGETISTNNQGSVVGEGWQLSGSGFIERTYNGCSVDGSGLSAEQSAAGDLCWSGDNDSISFAGHSGVLVPTGTAGQFRIQGDDGSRVDYLPHSTTCADGGSSNGCWRLTTQDGTQFFFGRSATSAWTVPVFGDDAGEPCHAATFAASVCAQPWRWNLDYVQDLRGNAEQFLYHSETNYYHRDKGALAQYVRGGYLTEVDYGMRVGSSAVADRVTLTYDTYGRCNQTTNRSTSCANEAGTTFATPAHPTYYPDVPWDQNCVAGGTCTGLNTPTFWTSQMLNSVTTAALVGTTMTTAQTWTLAHTFDNPGDTSAAAMWLASISHPGMQTTTFSGQFKNNRVWASHQVGGDTLAPLAKERIIAITNDTGGQVLVNYDTPDCTSANIGSINPSTNTHQCFPQWWSPPGMAMQQDWFFKYRVQSIIETPVTGGPADPSIETDYIYTGLPRWRFDQSAGAPASTRTWSVFAGYSDVEVRHGSSNSPSTQETTDYTFFQGMDSDPDGPAHTPTSHHRGDGVSGGVTLTVNGHTVTDSLWWAGRTLETVVRVGANGTSTTASSTPVLSDTVTLPWASAPTGSATLSYSYTDPADSSVYSGSLAWQAYLTGEASTITTATQADGGTRTITTATTHDGYGRVTQTSTVTPDAGSTCTTTGYATDPVNHTDTNLWLLSLPAEVSAVDVSCGVTPSYPDDAVSDTRYLYDGSVSSASETLSHGYLTETDAVDSYSGTTPHWQRQSYADAATGFDALGRPVSSYDAKNFHTTTAYTPTSAGPLTSTVVHNDKGWGANTTFSPLWGKPTSVQDANGNLTTASYDSLGRISQVWLPDRPVSGGAHTGTASIAYGYTNTSGKALSVSTTVLNSTGGTITTYTLMDGLGRQIQTQEGMDGTDPATGSPKVTGTVITDTFYDSAGRVTLVDNPFGTPSVLPSINRFPTETATQVPSQTQTAYDGAGRVTAVSQLGLNGATNTFGPLWSTTNSYFGVDRVDTTPPDGGTYTSTYTDSRGRTKELAQYTGASFASAHNSTKYYYDARGDLTSMTDQPGHAWTWTFDLLGRQISATDPDTGTTTTTYDPNGNVTDTVDADQHKLHIDYDDLNRKTAESEWQSGPAGFAQIAAWTYDSATLGKGLLAGSTRYVGSTPTMLGTAYSTAVSAYNTDGKPLATALSIPAWAGSATPSTYNWTYTYNQAGDQASVKDPAAGGINAEKITTSYDLLGQVYGVGGYAAYLANVLHTHTNQPALLQLTDGISEVDRSYSYDDATARLTELRVTTSATTGYHLADHLYTYKNDGELSQDSNTADGQGTDTQCYRYDQLQQLTQVWTPASTNCATDPTSTTLGGPAPYWTDYSSDPATGNRLSVINHATTSMGLDTKHIYNYPSSGSSQPHAVSSIDNYTAPAGNSSFMPVGSDTYNYDPSGNTTIRPGQSLVWDSQNHLATATTSAGATGNVYDADGNLLLQNDPTAGSTLFLGDTEVHVAPGSSTPTGVRTYTAYGSPIAERLTTAAAPTTVVQYWLDASPFGQNTVDEEVRSSDLATTHRYIDPYGNPRGDVPTWTSSHTFLNAPTNPTTGTIHLGARDYDPSMGRFLAPDPVLDPSNPLQSNGYSYGWNNPISNSDPAGLEPRLPGHCFSDDPACNNDHGGSEASPGNVAGDQCEDYACRYHPGVANSDTVARQARVDALTQTYTGSMRNPIQFFMSGANDDLNIGNDTVIEGGKLLCFGEAACDAARKHLQQNPNDISGAINLAANYCVDNPAKCHQYSNTQDIGVALLGVAAAGGLHESAGCGGESFTPDTEVLMANGTTKRLDQVQVGDRVQTTDPATGKSSVQTVTKVWVNHDHDLMDLTVRSGGKTSIIHTTQHHLIWDLTRHAWTEADQLKPGDSLRSANGTTAAVASTTTVAGNADMWDLTITTTHNFYIAVGSYDVLVHNCPNPAGQSGGRLTNSQMRDMAGRVGYKATNFRSRGQIVFTNGKNYITQDIDSHLGGLFKMSRTPDGFGTPATRLGTYDYDLNQVGP